MKKRVILLSICAITYAQSADLEKVTIEETINSQIVKDVSAKEIKSADLAEALSKNIPSVDIVRRSGIANDILLRGQKRDNINIIIDGTKVCGACVNRMDPPTSHVLTNNIQTVEVTEGPFDVENFGTLSGLVNIKTKKPTKELSGDITLNGGSFGYQKVAGSISGGTDRIRGLLSTSYEKGGQYKDGNGDDFAQQIINTTTGTVMAGAQYQPQYADMDAFEKSTLMGKIFFDITDNQELRLSYTANRSDNILYPSSKMDALYDDSDIYNLEYSIYNLSRYSKAIDFQIYQSEVDHPMSTKYRKMGTPSYKTHALTTKMQGVKLKNNFDLKSVNFTVGIDASRRNWDGHYETNGIPNIMPNGMLMKSLNDVDTTNQALFIKANYRYDNTDFEYGLRYDDTIVETANKMEPENDYSGLSGNMFATIHASDTLTYFAGLGKSSRVPDPRELYLVMMGNHIGTPDLKETQNYEVDFGVEKIYDNFTIKTKAYYSMLKDYIVYNTANKKAKADGSMGAFHSFENVDASIYGVELSGTVLATDELFLNYGISYKKGEKDNALTGQSSTNMPDMRPFKANISLNYENSDIVNASLAYIGSTKWSDVDYENGEQELAGYGVLNLKLSRDFSYGITLTAGVDNLLDKTYAITNTYKDLVLLTTGTDTMLLNEPGRYFYLNGTYKF